MSDVVQIHITNRCGNDVGRRCGLLNQHLQCGIRASMPAARPNRMLPAVSSLRPRLQLRCEGSRRRENLLRCRKQGGLHSPRRVPLAKRQVPWLVRIVRRRWLQSVRPQRGQNTNRLRVDDRQVQVSQVSIHMVGRKEPLWTGLRFVVRRGL